MNDALGNWKRTHYCGDLTSENIGNEVCLMGWVQRRRDHGGLIFIDLRDREGIAQLALDPDRDPEAHAKADKVRNEYVVAVKGTISPRPEGTINPKMKTGEVEIEVSELRILNTSKTPPSPRFRPGMCITLICKVSPNCAAPSRTNCARKTQWTSAPMR